MRERKGEVTLTCGVCCGEAEVAEAVALDVGIPQGSRVTVEGGVEAGRAPPPLTPLWGLKLISKRSFMADSSSVCVLLHSLWWRNPSSHQPCYR